MAPHRWIIAGWAALAVALVLAVVSLVLALDATAADTRIPSVGLSPLVDVRRLLVAVISAVVAGVAFFTGLACFFWSALRESRQQMARVLEALSASR